VKEPDIIVRPEHFLRYLRESLGLRPAQTRLPPIGVLVFGSGDFRAFHRVFKGRLKGWNRWLSVGTTGPKSVAVARSPIGAPAAAVTMEEMAALGCRTLLSFGACGSLLPDLRIGDLVLPTFAFSDEGTSRHYGKVSGLRPDASLLRATAAVCHRRGIPTRPGGTWTTDAVYRESRARARHLVARGVVAVEMEAAALWAVARHRKVRTASLFVVSDELGGKEWNTGFHDPRFLAGKKRARRLLVEVISKELS
jgi:uridine phosphorylase